MQWLGRWRWSARADLALALVCCAVAQLEVAVLGPNPVRVVCAALATLPIALRQRAPLIAAALVSTSWAAFHLWDGVNGKPVFYFAALPVIYSVGAHPKLAWAMTGGGMILAVGETAQIGAHDGRGDYAFLAFVIVLVWLSGRGARIHRDQSAQLRELSARLAGERDVIERLATAQERRRMASELHDAIAHAVSLMVIQAGGAEQLVGRDPDRVRAALTAVQDTGRQAITELQRVLHILRTTPGIAPEQVAPPPTPAPARWPHLLPHSSWADLVLAVLVVVTFDAPVFLAAHEARVPITITAVGAVLAIAIRRRHPFTALTVALVTAAATQVVLGDAMGYSPFIATIVTLYTVLVHTQTRHAIPAAVGAILVVNLATAATLGPASLPLDTAWFLALLIGGGCVRMYRHQAERLRTLTARLLREREARARARLAVLEERARVARELHDSVAHAVSVMVLQAGAAEQVLSASSERARAAIRAVEAQGQLAHNDLRHLLGILDQGGASQRTPQPSLTHLDSLLAQVAQAGLPVTLHVRGQPAPLSIGLDISAYRIVQEGLTNTLKHAGRVPTTVTLDYRPEALTIEIHKSSNGSQPPPNTHDGHGLLGMRERTALYGGTLETVHRAGSGFVLTVCLPLEPDRRQLD